MTFLLFCEHLYTVLAEKNLFGFMCFCNIKNISTFSSFLVKDVCSKSLFFRDLALSIFEISYVILVGISCVDGVIVAEIVVSGSQFMSEFDQIFFYHILIDLIFFYFFVLWFYFKIILNYLRHVLSDE